MPQPNSPPNNNQQYNSPGGVPFGAGTGWSVAPQNPSPQQPPNTGAYPSPNNGLPQHPPYSGFGGGYPPYPMGGGNPTQYPPYPGSNHYQQPGSYLGNNHYQQPTPYPPMGQPQTSSYPHPQENNRPISQPPYPGAFNYIQHQSPAPSSQQFHQQSNHQHFGNETYMQSHTVKKVCIEIILY